MDDREIDLLYLHLVFKFLFWHAASQLGQLHPTLTPFEVHGSQVLDFDVRHKVDLEVALGQTWWRRVVEYLGLLRLEGLAVGVGVPKCRNDSVRHDSKRFQNN